MICSDRAFSPCTFRPTRCLSNNARHSMSQFSPSLSAPYDPGVIGAAVQWLQGTILGSAATAVAIIAVASIGLLMLSGRVDWRRATSALVGCFILFGAPGIAAALQGPASPGGDFAPRQVAPAPMLAPLPPKLAPNRSGYDPYAGASVPDVAVE